MRVALRIIDNLSEYTGRFIRWFCAILMLILTFEVISRHIFNHPTQWAHQTSLMMSGALIALGWAYVHRHRAHVRVDVIYSHFSPRGQALTDVILDIMIFFPLMAALIYAAWTKMLYSWEMNEVMVETYWFPPVGPNRTVVLIGLALLGLQGVSNFIKNAYLLLRNKPYD